MREPGGSLTASKKGARGGNTVSPTGASRRRATLTSTEGRSSATEKAGLLARAARASSSGSGLSSVSAISARSAGRVRENGHVRDVDAGLAEQGPEAADHAGPVVVDDEEHQRLELDLDLVAERPDEPGLVLRPGRRAGDRDALRRPQAALHRDQAREVLRGPAPLLADLDPALAGDERCVHVVHRLLDAVLEDRRSGPPPSGGACPAPPAVRGR